MIKIAEGVYIKEAAGFNWLPNWLSNIGKTTRPLGQVNFLNKLQAQDAIRRISSQYTTQQALKPFTSGQWGRESLLRLSKMFPQMRMS